MYSLEDSIAVVKGIGPARKKLFEKLKIYTVRDLLFQAPRAYEDRSALGSFTMPNYNDDLVYRVKVDGKGVTKYIRRNFSVTNIPVSVEGIRGNLTYFNQPYQKNRFKVGQEYFAYGKLKRSGRFLNIQNPIVLKPDDLHIEPTYALTKGLTQKIVRDAVKDALQHVTLSEELLLRHEIPTLFTFDTLLNKLHYPDSIKEGLMSRKTLALEELVRFQLNIRLDRFHEKQEEEKGIAFPQISLLDDMKGQLPFTLTEGQEKALHELLRDLQSGHETNRLIQGDVGSGKTVIAALTMYLAYRHDYQSVLMAPTEILATQHLESFTELLPKDENIHVALLTGSLTEKEKKNIKEGILLGNYDMVIGTHALLEDDVQFKKLGLVITDEQHRFGVKQRDALQDKAENVNRLVMTATPIPRTLAITLYGDMDITSIKGLPPGRKEIKTYAVAPTVKDRIYQFVAAEIEAGRQAYFICPMIDDNETLDIMSTEMLMKELEQSILGKYHICEMHGKLSAAEKDEAMVAFERGDIDILVSTTVVEVGVNVPNATMMVIYNAERFGLAQIHQLRGRVGRGDAQSYCVLINHGQSDIAIERMKILQQSTDGFLIADKDLELRGPGELFGLRQHGIPKFLIADLALDHDLLLEAKRLALKFMATDENMFQKEIRDKAEKYQTRLKEINS